MYFTKIRLTGLTVIDFPVVGALPTDPYLLKEADGLGPPEVDVSIAPTLNAGGVYKGRRPQSREVVLKVGLNPDFTTGQTASDLRTTLYGLLTPGSTDKVVLSIMNGTTVLANTTCYVSKLEIVPFSAEPLVQITLPCLEPYFLAPALYYASPQAKTSFTISNTGTAPTGFKFAVSFTGSAAGWSLTHATGQMVLTYAFQAGYVLTIDTQPGSRSIKVHTGAQEFSILYTLSQTSIWLMLHGGVNSFNAANEAYTWGTWSYYPAYWGI